MSSLTHYMENKLADWRFRGQSYTPPANHFIGFFTVMPTKAGGGTEVVGDSYVRQPVPSDLANWSGTQGAGTTVVSSGTSATISNNVEIQFPTPTEDWGDVVGVGLWDAETGGNLEEFAPLTGNVTKTISTGDDVRIPVAAMTAKVDNAS